MGQGVGATHVHSAPVQMDPVGWGSAPPHSRRRTAVPSLCAMFALALSGLLVPSGRGPIPRPVLDGTGIEMSPRFASSPSSMQRVTGGGRGDQLAFEPNVGQADRRVRYLARGAGYTLFLTDDGATLVLPRSPVRGLRTRGASMQPPTTDVGLRARHLLLTLDDATTVVTVRLVGATVRPRLVASGRLPGVVNYYIGADPRRWRTHIPTYARVAYQGVLPGSIWCSTARAVARSTTWCCVQASTRPACG